MHLLVKAIDRRPTLGVLITFTCCLIANLNFIAIGVLALFILTKPFKQWINILFVGLIMGAVQYKTSLNSSLLLLFFISTLATLTFSKSYSWKNTILLISGLSTGSFFALQILSIDFLTDFLTQLKNVLNQIKINNASSKMFDTFDETLLTEKSIALFFSSTICFMSILGVIIGRWWQSLLFYAGGFSKEFQAFKLDPLTATALILCIVITQVYNEFSFMLIFVIIPFVFSGVALMHAFAKAKRIPIFLLSSFYIFLLLGNGLILVFIAILDSFVDFRKPWQSMPDNE
jgi:hypothetical protein